MSRSTCRATGRLALDDEKRRLTDELADPALGLDRRAVVLRRLDEIDADLLEVDARLRLQSVYRTGRDDGA